MEQDMKYIYQVYLDGSFSAAAEHLYMSQPALSIAVKRVEESVGAELFDRGRRPLALTEAGRALQEKAKDVPAHVASCIDLPPEKARTLYLLLYELLDRQNNKETDR